MAIHELNEEQIRTWTLEAEGPLVARRTSSAATCRSSPCAPALTGMLLGGLLSLTNLYVGAKTGWTLGVGITSVILAFAMFKVLVQHRPGRRVHHPRKQRHAVDRHGGRLHDVADDLQPGRLHDGHRPGHPAVADDVLDHRAGRPGRAVRLSVQAALHQRRAAAVPRGPGRRHRHGLAAPRRRREPACSRPSCWSCFGGLAAVVKFCQSEAIMRLSAQRLPSSPSRSFSTTGSTS